MQQQISSSLTALLVSNKESSIHYYRDVLGFDVTDWWAERDGLKGLALKLLQAGDAADVRPNQPEAGSTRAYDVYAYVDSWIELDRLYDEFVSKGAIISGPPIIYPEGGPWKEFIVQDLDGYNLAFGGVDGHKTGSFIQDNIDSVYLWVSDLESSIALYSQFMGLQICSEDRRGLAHTFKLSSGMNVIIETKTLNYTQASEMGPALFKLRTTDIEAACQHARDLGFQIVFGIVHEPKVSYFNIRDADGNMITVEQSCNLIEL